MRIIGLTGGIASGKSTVSQMFKELGAVIIDADMVARDVVKPGERGFNGIVNAFGKSMLNDDGTLNRKALGDIVFNDSEKLKLLNSIIHPEIKYVIMEKIDEIKKECYDSIIIVDAAVLLESGTDELVDEVWLVYADVKTQLKRLMKRDNMTQEEACIRMQTQMPIEDKIKRSDEIIDNSLGLNYTKEQVMKLWQQVINQYRGEPVAFKE